MLPIDSLRHIYARYFYAIHRQTHTHRLRDGVKTGPKTQKEKLWPDLFSTEQSQIFLEYKNVARNLTQTYKTKQIFNCAVELKDKF